MNGFDLSTASDIVYNGSTVTAVYCGSTLIWPRHDYSRDYFTIRSRANNNTITWIASDSSLLRTISVSTDDGSTWTQYTSSTSGTTIATLDDGEYILVKGTNTFYGDGTNRNKFNFSDEADVEGNIISLIDGDNFIGHNIISENYVFAGLFRGNTKIKNARNLVLPSFILTQGCYASMFRDCTSLIAAPTLPATYLTTRCYTSMFDGCTSLTTSPALPATYLGEGCYYNMFHGCTSLTTPPVLQATTLATECYLGMFQQCTSLTTPPALPATTLAPYCYASMFNGCTSLTIAPVLPATTLATDCYADMFYYCTGLITAPELPATTLVDYCYLRMFEGCSRLNNIICLATDISATGCTSYWLNIVSSTGTFTKNSAMSSWTTGTSGIPSGWTVQDY